MPYPSDLAGADISQAGNPLVMALWVSPPASQVVTVPLLVPPAPSPSLVLTYGCIPWGCPHRAFHRENSSAGGDPSSSVSNVVTSEEELQGLSVQGKNCHRTSTTSADNFRFFWNFPSPLLPWQVLCQLRYHLELWASTEEEFKPKIPEKTPWLIHWQVIVSPTQPLTKCSRAGVYGALTNS